MRSEFAECLIENVNQYAEDNCITSIENNDVVRIALKTLDDMDCSYNIEKHTNVYGRRYIQIE